MALKMEIETIEGLPEPIVKEYKKVEADGKVKFVLDVEGLEDTGALKRAKDYEKKARQDAEKLVKDLTLKQETIQNELDEIRRGAIPKGDVEKLEGSWKAKLEKREAELQTQLAAANGSLQKLLVDNVAQTIATKISTAPELILPHVKSRLTTEIQDGNYVTRVLDAAGKPSALSIEELQKEFTTDKRFSAIIVGSKASGGGASGGGGAGGAPPLSDKFDFNKATPKELAARIKAQKEAKGG